MDLNYSSLPFTVYKINPISYDDAIYQNMNINSSKHNNIEDYEKFSKFKNFKLKNLSKNREIDNIKSTVNNFEILRSTNLMDKGNHLFLNEKMNRSLDLSNVNNRRELPSPYSPSSSFSNKFKESLFFKSFEKEKRNKISFHIASISNDKKLKSNYKLIKELNPSYDKILGSLNFNFNSNSNFNKSNKSNNKKIQETKEARESREAQKPHYSKFEQNPKYEFKRKRKNDSDASKMKNIHAISKGNSQTKQNWHNITKLKNSSNRISEIIENLTKKNKNGKNGKKEEHLNKLLNLSSYNNSKKNPQNSYNLNSLPQVKPFVRKSLYKSLLNKTVQENKNLYLFQSKDYSLNIEQFSSVECPYHHLRNKSYNRWDNLPNENFFDQKKRSMSSQFNYKNSDKKDKNLQISQTESYLFELISNFKRMSQIENKDLNLENIDEIINLKKVDQITISLDTIKIFYKETLIWSQELFKRIFNYFASIQINNKSYLNFQDFVKFNLILVYNIGTLEQIINFWIKIIDPLNQQQISTSIIRETLTSFNFINVEEIINLFKAESVISIHESLDLNILEKKFKCGILDVKNLFHNQILLRNKIST